MKRRIALCTTLILLFVFAGAQIARADTVWIDHQSQRCALGPFASETVTYTPESDPVAFQVNQGVPSSFSHQFELSPESIAGAVGIFWEPSVTVTGTWTPREYGTFVVWASAHGTEYWIGAYDSETGREYLTQMVIPTGIACFRATRIRGPE